MLRPDGKYDYIHDAREEILQSAQVVYGSDAWKRLKDAVHRLEFCVRSEEQRRAARADAEKETADAG